MYIVRKVLIILIITTAGCASYTDKRKNDNTAYSNAEAIIYFNEKILIKKDNFVQPGTGYLSRATVLVKFCAYRPQPAHIQSVGPDEDGYLCKMYQLPYTSKEEIVQLYRQCRQNKKAYEHYLHYREHIIDSLQVISWRYQLGKTRLDHYFVYGDNPKYVYLFISSPYGSNGDIEKIIGNIRVK